LTQPDIDFGAAQLDGLRLNYAPLYIENLRRRHAAEGNRTVAGQLTAAKIHATANDLAAARACLGRVFSIFGPPDEAMWEEYVWAAFVCRQMDLAAWLIRERFGAAPDFSFSLGGDTTRSWPINAFKYRIIERFSGACEIHQSMYENRHTEFLIHRLLAMLPLLASYAVHDEVQCGTVVLNIGDVGSLPGLAFCENRDEFFLVPDNYFVESQGYRALREHHERNPVAWEDRQPVAFWRGATTGLAQDAKLGWRSLPRVRLCEMAQADQTGMFDVGLSRVAVVPGDPAGDEISASGLIRPYVPSTEFQNYKYQIDIDGHSNSWPGLFQKLLTGSTVLKVASAAGFRQWYYDRLRPWVNFVPVAADMSDLAGIVMWLRNHDDAAREIGARGQALALGMDYPGELQRAGRTIGAALRYFAGLPEMERRFAAEGTGQDCLRGTWGARVEDGIETNGFVSQLELPRPVQNEDYVLLLEMSVAAELTSTRQRLAVVVNGQVVLETMLAQRQVLQCGVSAQMIQAADRMCVMLLHPDARPAASMRRPLETGIASAVLHGVSLMLARLHELRDQSVFAWQTIASSETAPMAVAPATLPDGVQPRRVITHHKTELYIDESTGALRHGPSQSGAHNTGLVVQHDTAFICYRGADGTWRPPANFLKLGMSLMFVAARDDGSPVYTFDIAAGTKGEDFGLRRDGLLLCAESDGRITLSRRKRGPWESFRLGAG
jgi:hypothetical protein